jgi:hypothetical protein
MRTIRNTGDFSITERGNTLGNQLASGALNIVVVQSQCMEIRVETQCVAEALNEVDCVATDPTI